MGYKSAFVNLLLTFAEFANPQTPVIKHKIYKISINFQSNFCSHCDEGQVFLDLCYENSMQNFTHLYTNYLSLYDQIKQINFSPFVFVVVKMNENFIKMFCSFNNIFGRNKPSYKELVTLI